MQLAESFAVIRSTFSKTSQGIALFSYLLTQHHRAIPSVHAGGQPHSWVMGGTGSAGGAGGAGGTGGTAAASWGGWGGGGYAPAPGPGVVIRHMVEGSHYHLPSQLSAPL